MSRRPSHRNNRSPWLLACIYLFAMLGCAEIGLLLTGRTPVAMAQFTTANPDLAISGSCSSSIKIALILDASLSIDNTELGQLRSGVLNFLSNLSTKAPNRFQVGIVEFALNADLLQGFTPVNPTTIGNAATNGTFTNSMNSKFPDRSNNWSSVDIDIYTNWEAGFKKAYDTLNDADLVIFITDGNPNAYLNAAGNAVIVVSSPTPTQAQATIAINEATAVTNLWKSQGKKIIAVGVAEVASSIPANFLAITDNTNTLLFNPTTNNLNLADYLSISTFADFGTGITNLSNGICVSAPSNVTVSGTVFRDTNANKLRDGSETGNNAGGLNAIMSRRTNAVVATTAVGSDGVFTFNNIPGSDNYTIQITTATAATNASTPAVTLPSTWYSTGENLGGITDATVDSKLSVTVATSNVTDINFGINSTNNANLLLVKRITAIKDGKTGNVTNFTQVLDNPDTSNDNNSKWPSGYLKGGYNTATTGKVKPGDEIEYTIYYLNANGANAKNVKICDRIVGQQAFVNDGYGTGTGIQLQIGTGSLLTLTNAQNSNIDRAQFTSTTTTPTGCNLTPLSSGTIDNVVSIDLTGSSGQPTNLTEIPSATSQLTAQTNYYGRFRFKTKVNP
jgi:hypothetical protein